MSEPSYIAFDYLKFAPEEVVVVALDGDKFRVELGRGVSVYMTPDAAERLAGMLLDALAARSETDCALMRPAPEGGE